MDKVTLGFKAFDPHELLPHALAERLGYYRDVDLEVALRDTTFLSDEDFTGRLFTPACGAALISALRGAPQKVVLAATDLPMFWICSDQHSHLGDLRGLRVASFPFFAPPHTLLRIIFRQAGIDPDHDLELLPVRDDFTRLALLQRGAVNAAVVSSCRPTAADPRTQHLRRIFFGDSLRVVSSGLATSRDLILEEPGLVERMSTALRRALTAIHEQPEEAVAAIGPLIDGDEALSGAAYAGLRDLFTRNGRAGAQCLRDGVALVADELEIADPPALEKIYDSSILGP